MNTWSAKFWLTVLENVLVVDITTFLVAAGTTDTVGEVRWGVVAWALVISTAGAVLKSLVGKTQGDKQTANFVS